MMGTSCACCDPRIFQLSFLAILEGKSVSLHKIFVCEFIYSRLFARVHLWSDDGVFYRQTHIRSLLILWHQQQRPNTLTRGVSTLSHPRPVSWLELRAFWLGSAFWGRGRGCVSMKHSACCYRITTLPMILAVVSETPQYFLTLRRSKTASRQRALCGKCGQISVCLERQRVGHCHHWCGCGFEGGCAEMCGGGQGQGHRQALKCIALYCKITWKILQYLQYIWQ